MVRRERKKLPFPEGGVAFPEWLAEIHREVTADLRKGVFTLDLAQAMCKSPQNK